MSRDEKQKSDGRRKVNAKTRLYSFLIAAVVILFFVISYQNNFVNIFELNAKIKSLETEISSLQEESSRLDDDLSQIGTKAYNEKIARKYLGLYYPDEKIVVPVEKKDADERPNEENSEEIE